MSQRTRGAGPVFYPVSQFSPWLPGQALLPWITFFPWGLWTFFGIHGALLVTSLAIIARDLFRPRRMRTRDRRTWRFPVTASRALRSPRKVIPNFVSALHHRRRRRYVSRTVRMS